MEARPHPVCYCGCVVCFGVRMLCYLNSLGTRLLLFLTSELADRVVPVVVRQHGELRDAHRPHVALEACRYQPKVSVCSLGPGILGLCPD